MSTPENPKPVASPAPQTPDGPAPSPGDDASTQALAEALESSFKIVKFLMLGLVVLFFLSGMFTVEPNQLAVRLRAGSPVGVGEDKLLKPGWHWAFPYPIDEVVKIPVGQTHVVTSSVGWYATTPDLEATGKEPPPVPMLRPGADGYTLTADGNIIHVRASLTYRIIQPLDYTFRFRNASNVLQSVVDNAIIYASAHSTAEDAIYKNQPAFKELVMTRVTTAVDQLKLGVSVQVREIRSSAPLEVRPAFEAVLTAQQEARTKVNEAEGYAVSLTNNAVALRRMVLDDGMTSSNRIVQTLSAEAQSFSDQLPFYRENPKLRSQLLMADTMGRVLTNAQDKFFVPVGSTTLPHEVRLLLNREPQKSRLQNFILQGKQ